ncbi:MAG: fucose isomerase [Candidatus Thorarchaeota archaeon]|nr:MAG: fucose isomerase [Candidatus Thorarchaeota archaeon]
MGVNIIHFVSPVSPEGLEQDLAGTLEETGASVYNDNEFLDLLKNTVSALGDHNYIFVGTGGTENAIIEFVQSASLEQPIRLLSYEGRNSLPAAMEARTGLQKMGFESRIIHNQIEDLMKELSEWVAFALVEEKIRGTRFGIVGNPSFWLVGSSVDPLAVKDKWGFEIEEFSLNDLLHRMGDKLSPDYEPVLKELVDGAMNVDRPNDELERAAVFSQTLKEFITEKGLNTVTVECFRLFEEKDVSGCHALSHLNDQDGITAGCEGDIPSTFTMMLAEILTGRPSFMANVADVDSEENTALFAHCTCPTSLLEDYEITTHYETGSSVAIRGRFKPQPVTILKVSGSSLDEYWVSSGEIVESTRSDNACRTQIRVRLDEPVSYFLEGSLANHHVVVPGDHSETFRRFLSFKLEF